MSLESWEIEFYTVPADKVSKENAAKHSLKKWEGLRQENLDKHSLMHNRSCIIQKNDVTNYLEITSSSCALCIHHLNNFCKSCPLYIIRGDHRCDSTSVEEDKEERNPYHEWVFGGNPEPMIELIKSVIS